MSKDIRSFFKPVQQKKKPPVLSDDEIIEDSPVPERKQKTPRAKGSDKDKNRTSGKKKTPPSKEKLKPVNAMDLFGTTPVKQSKVTTAAKQQQNQINSNNDKESKKDANAKKQSNEKKFYQTLQELDDEDAKEAKAKKESNEKKFNQTLQELDDEMEVDLNELDKTIDEALKEDPNASRVNLPVTPKNNKKRKAENLNESVLTDQEKFERRQQSFLAYKNRPSPPNKGNKEYPEGKPNCLSGLCFVKSGVLDSLDGDDFKKLVKKHGGRTVAALSRKVNYLVVGEAVGESKLEKARSLGTPEISEDDFLDMILTKSGLAPKYKTNTENNNENDLEEMPAKKRKVSLEDSPVKIKSEPVTPKKDKAKAKSTKTPTKASTDTKPLRTSPRKALRPETDIKEEATSPSKVPKLSTTMKAESRPQIASTTISNDNKSWTEKYKPSDLKQIIGQQDGNSNMKKLMHWLTNWSKYHAAGSTLKPQRPSPWAKNDDGAFFKAALLSGAPGVGKTTTATLVAKELGYDVVEFNASDTRSKKLLQEEVSTLLGSKSLVNFFKDGGAPTSKHVLLMDEVDGMSGNQDRGGVQELIALIKNSSVPIICICNDRQHPKIRSLCNYCFDLRFSKIRPEAIRGAMMSVCFKEGVKIKPDALMQMIVSTGSDIRQTLNHLAMWSATSKDLTSDLIQRETKGSKKDTVLGPWEVVRKVFSAEEHKTMSFEEKNKLFYYDYNISPLFVQENYLHVEPAGRNALRRAALAADAISRGDVIESKIRSGNNWSLMEAQAFHASVLPGHYMSGRFKDQINFPGWLGKNSKTGKFQRLATELQSHMRLSASASKDAVNLDYVYALRDAIVNPLVRSGNEGVAESVGVMKDYSLLREDLDSILELSQWSKQKDPMARVESKVKAAFTRAYNKDGPVLPYSIESVSKKRTATKEDAYGDEEEENDSEEDKDDIGNDAMIKEKKPTAKAKKAAAGEASTSKKAPAKPRAKKAK